MEKQSFWKKFSQLLNDPSKKEILEAFKEISPFYLMVTLVVGWVYYQVVQTTPSLEDPKQHALFIVLLLVHLLLQ